jgi:anti-anti-sigma regulatory factor
VGGTSIERVRPGDHACLVFTDSEERLDLVAAFVRDGLRAGQRVICLTEAIPEAALADELARRGLDITSARQDGQLQVVDSGKFFVPQGSFDPERVIGEFRKVVASAGRDGYQGLRITSDMGWTLRPVTGLADLPAYESQLTALLGAGNATAVCQYDRQRFDTVTISTALEGHSCAVAAVTYHDDALLRICRQHVPPGMRAAGELDYRAIDPLTTAMTEALSLDAHIDVNLTQLRFIDTSAAGVIVQAAVGLSNGQRMTVRCQPVPYKIFETLGLRDLPRVTLRAVDHDH